MKKIFVLDTNVLLQDPGALLGFADNDVYLVSTVLDELDSKKNNKKDPEIAHHARDAIRLIESARAEHDLVTGVKLPNGGTLYAEPDGVSQQYLPNGFSIDKPDNKIISTCKYLQEKHKDQQVILVSLDIEMRISASIILGAENVQDYKNRIVQDDDTFTGHVDMDVDPEVINALYSSPDGTWTGKKTRAKKKWNDGLTENLFVTLHAGSQSALTVYQKGALHLIRPKEIFNGVKGLNALQHYAIWALTNPEIPLVILLGPAGTAKTYLSLAAGLTQTYTSQRMNERLYQKMLVSRPNAEAGDPGFGYLPGSLKDKMAPLLLPYYDNLESLFSGDERATAKMQVEDLFANGTIELCALSFIRGRSLTNCYMICDEAQNASRILIRDVITRAGHGCKIVLAGDPDQCDSIYLDKYSNGLVFAADRFRDSPLAAIIKFGEGQSVRSPLAKETLARMQL
ncbi:MAG: PhoH family protein [Lachnospiraceae bacterium]|nr:PhoH family protein [Lachnospiraceae bacterium]